MKTNVNFKTMEIPMLVTILSFIAIIVVVISLINNRNNEINKNNELIVLNNELDHKIKEKDIKIECLESHIILYKEELKWDKILIEGYQNEARNDNKLLIRCINQNKTLNDKVQKLIKEKNDNSGQNKIK